MATVKIPTPLRRYTDKQKSVIIEGETVNEVINNLLQQYPDICDRICKDGELRRFVNIFVGSEYLDELEGMDTVVDDDTTVRIILPIAGG